MYYAHTSDDERKQLLQHHLMSVGKLSGQFAEKFGAPEWGYLIGQGHDIGKYTAAFQKRLLENGPKVDHSTAGGKVLLDMINIVGAYPIFGHHSGLPDGGDASDMGGEPTFHGRRKKKIDPDYQGYKEELVLKRPAQMPPIKPLGKEGFTMSFFIRMLFSCLVDADFLDTEAFMNDGKVNRGNYDSIEEIYHKVMKQIEKFKDPKKELHVKRNKILNQCLAAAEWEKGLFSLTVPTGGGKTIASLAFGYSHAQKWNIDRMIYVIPYTSIIEQNCKVFGDIIGKDNVVEHHFNVNYDDASEDEKMVKKKLATENWDAPLIATTNVQFFESLYASKTSKCRKLHNIANSVIVLDEAQMIPLPYLEPCVRVLVELVHNYGCSVVLCTATQPALDFLLPKEVKRREICEDGDGMFESFRRTEIKYVGQVTDREMTEKMNELKQVLTIVNTRKQAQALFSSLEVDGSYHLSTLMYPEHRSKILNEIRDRLKQGEPCRVVATSMIEAGVDVDFPTAYREKAGLDSVIQAAGRCNREGNNSARDSVVHVFESEGTYAKNKPGSLKQPMEVFDIVARKHEDLASLSAIHDYFSKLYQLKGEYLDKHQIVKRLDSSCESFPYRTIDKEFNLIETETHLILIPEEGEEKAKEFERRLRSGERSRSLMRSVGRYSVNVYTNHYEELRARGVIEVLDSEIAVLADLNCYSKKIGLTLDVETGFAVHA